MANKRYDQFSAGSALPTRILLTADATTGALTKNTVGSMFTLNASTDNQMAIIQNVGSPIIATVLNIPPFLFPTFGALTNGRSYSFGMMLPDCTVTGGWIAGRVPGNYTAASYNGIGLYKKGTTQFDLVAFTVDDGNLFKNAQFVTNFKAFASPYVASAGLYLIAVLWNASAVVTAPSPWGISISVVDWFATGVTNHYWALNNLLGIGSTFPSSKVFSGGNSNTGFCPCMGVY